MMRMNIFNKLNHLNILLIQENKSCNDIVYNLLYENSNNVIQTIVQKEIISGINEKLFDMVFIDFSLSKDKASKIIEAIREIDIMIPIIALSTKEEQLEIVSSVNLLIEGFIIKPIDKEKLSRALLNCLKRIEYLKPEEFLLSQSISYFHNTNELKRDGDIVPLAKKEAQLLELLIKNIGRIVPIDEIEWELWDNEDVGESALKSVIQRLRKEVGKKHIRSHSGIGYSLDRRGS